MIAGHLREKNGYYHMIIGYPVEGGAYKTVSISTGLPAKGNKKRAEELLAKTRREFVIPSDGKDKLLFADYLIAWLDIVKPSVTLNTFAGYSNSVKNTLAPYFRRTGVLLSELQIEDIQAFYDLKLKTVKPVTIARYHAHIHHALKTAVKRKLIRSNPSDYVDLPKKEKFIGSFYDKNEINKLFEVSKGTKLELPIQFATFYGLRREEVLGLKWDAFDFERDTFIVQHTRTVTSIDGKRLEIAQDRTKNQSSRRTFPLVPSFKKRLIDLIAEQEANRKLCGKSYRKDYMEYLCVDIMGNPIQPNYISSQFPVLLKQNGLRCIRFHDLRHSCASLLLANGLSMKQIQEWMGHSDFGTTANIYSHLDYRSKIASADTMLAGLNMTLPVAADTEAKGPVQLSVDC
ncbi:MAG: site-specific integrase [Pseudoflavonifractor sp.]